MVRGPCPHPIPHGPGSGGPGSLPPPGQTRSPTVPSVGGPGSLSARHPPLSPVLAVQGPPLSPTVPVQAVRGPCLHPVPHRPCTGGPGLSIQSGEPCRALIQGPLVCSSRPLRWGEPARLVKTPPESPLPPPPPTPSRARDAAAQVRPPRSPNLGFEDAQHREGLQEGPQDRASCPQTRGRVGRAGPGGGLRGASRLLRKSEGEAPALIGRPGASSMPVMFW